MITLTMNGGKVTIDYRKIRIFTSLKESFGGSKVQTADGSIIFVKEDVIEIVEMIHREIQKEGGMRNG